MSRKRADPRTTRAAQRRAEAAAAAARQARSQPVGAGRRRATRIVIAALVLVVAALGLGMVLFVAGGSGGRPVSSSPPPPSVAATPAPSGSALVGGGPLPQKLVAALHADPFRAHIDETTVARSTAGTVTVTITAKAVGDVSGRDVALHVTGTGAGPAVDQQVVSIGNATWIRRTGATAWEIHRRTEAASSIDGLLTTIRLIDDPAVLADAGVETVDGQSLHRLTAIGSIAYRSPDGADGAYDRLDIWTTDAGIPVLARGSFSAQSGTNALVGNVSIKYSDVGKAVTIAPPSGAPSPIP